MGQNQSQCPMVMNRKLSQMGQNQYQMVMSQSQC